MSQGPLCPNLTQKVQKEVSQMANRNLPIGMLLGGLSVNLNHLKTPIYQPLQFDLNIWINENIDIKNKSGGNKLSLL